jgi:hypothetical protein
MRRSKSGDKSKPSSMGLPTCRPGRRRRSSRALIRLQTRSGIVPTISPVSNLKEDLIPFAEAMLIALYAVLDYSELDSLLRRYPVCDSNSWTSYIHEVMSPATRKQQQHDSVHCLNTSQSIKHDYRASLSHRSSHSREGLLLKLLRLMQEFLQMANHDRHILAVLASMVAKSGHPDGSDVNYVRSAGSQLLEALFNVVDEQSIAPLGLAIRKILSGSEYSGLRKYLGSLNIRPTRVVWASAKAPAFWDYCNAYHSIWQAFLAYECDDQNHCDTTHPLDPDVEPLCFRKRVLPHLELLWARAKVEVQEKVILAARGRICAELAEMIIECCFEAEGLAKDFEVWERVEQAPPVLRKLDSTNWRDVRTMNAGLWRLRKPYRCGPKTPRIERIDRYLFHPCLDNV